MIRRNSLEQVRAIAAKEFTALTRNRWLAACTLLFTALSVSVLFGTGALSGAQLIGDLQGVAESFSALAMYFLPLLAALTVSDSFAAERENGTLLLMLSYPVGRTVWLTGKILGFWSGVLLALVPAVLVLPAAKLLVAFDWAWPQTLEVSARLFLSGALYTLIFICWGCWISLLARTKAQAQAGLLLLWFLLVFVWDLAVIVIAVATNGAMGRSFLLAVTGINCADVFRLMNGVSWGGVSLPSSLCWLVLFLWCAVGCALASHAIRRLIP